MNILHLCEWSECHYYPANCHEFQDTLRIPLHLSLKSPSSANGSLEGSSEVPHYPWSRHFAASTYIQMTPEEPSIGQPEQKYTGAWCTHLGLREQTCSIARIWFSNVEVWTGFHVNPVHPHPS